MVKSVTKKKKSTKMVKKKTTKEEKKIVTDIGKFVRTYSKKAMVNKTSAIDKKEQEKLNKKLELMELQLKDYRSKLRHGSRKYKYTSRAINRVHETRTSGSLSWSKILKFTGYLSGFVLLLMVIVGIAILIVKPSGNSIEPSKSGRSINISLFNAGRDIKLPSFHFNKKEQQQTE